MSDIDQINALDSGVAKAIIAGDAALTGKYIVTGKNTVGGLKIHCDIWNFNA